jgi:hypothetical protein
MTLEALSLDDDGPAGAGASGGGAAAAGSAGAAAADLAAAKSTEAEDALASQEEEDKPAAPELIAMTDPVRLFANHCGMKS